MISSETLHRMAIHGARLIQSRSVAPPTNPLLHQNLWGLEFLNPVGLAAGFDKNGEAPNAWGVLGFGFAELGTVTPLPQQGNPKRPRVFRLSGLQAYVNKLGFNNEGMVAVSMRLDETIRRIDVPMGINVGKAWNTPLDQALHDYQEVISVLQNHADYLVLNVSSPNTSGLSQLQEVHRLEKLLVGLFPYPKPLLVKIGPNLSSDEIRDVAQLTLGVGASGMIATNTMNILTGGLSGKPLCGPALKTLRTAYVATDGKLPLIGVGGIVTPLDAYQRIRAGASLVQIFTGMLFHGPLLPRRIVKGLVRLLCEDGHSIRTAVGADA